VSLASGYVAAARVGTPTLTALDLARADSGSAPAPIAAAVDEIALDLRIVPQPLRVVAVQPAQGARNIPLSSPVSVVFSKPIDPASIAGPNAGRPPS